MGENIESSMWLFFCYLQGIGTDIDKTLACEHLLAAAKSGNPIARSLSHRAVVTLLDSPSSPIPPKTMAQWLLRSYEMGCLGAKEDFAHLVQSVHHYDDELATTLLHWFPTAVNRLRSYTSGVGVGHFLDAQGRRLSLFSIDSQAEFEVELSTNAKESGFNINGYTVNSRGDTLLHFTSTCGFHEATVFLIHLFRGSLDIHSKNEDGETALLSASRAGQLKTVRTLLANGADLRPSNSGESPLHWLGSFTTNIPEIVSLMLCNSNGEYIGTMEGRTTALNQQASRSRYSPYWDSEFPAGTPLHRAVHFKNTTIVQALLDEGANPESPGIDETQASPLQLSCVRHHADILKAFLDKMQISDVNQLSGPSLLHTALSTYSNLISLVNNGVKSRELADLKETIALLMSRNADPGPLVEDTNRPDEKFTALFKAVQSNSIPCVEIALSKTLLTSPSLLNRPCGTPPLTPLNIAVENGSFPIIKALICAGADPRNPSDDQRNVATMTVLHSCALMDFSLPASHATLVFNELLAPYFPNVDLKPTSDDINADINVLESPFVLAVRLQQFHFASALLDRGANIDFEFNHLVRDMLEVGHYDITNINMDAGDNSTGSATLLITLLGSLLRFQTPAILSSVKFLLGYDHTGRKKADWRYDSPSAVVCKASGWTVWHVIAARRVKVPIYAADLVREMVSYLVETYQHLGKEFVSMRSVSAPRVTALHVAAECTNTEVVAALLRLGANANEVDDHGARPVDYALNLLLEEIEIDEESGWTEAEVRTEIQRRKDVYQLLGGDMDIFENDLVDELSVMTVTPL
jgi:ankyrin repeat protein